MCDGGPNDGNVCATDVDCPGGVCPNLKDLVIGEKTEVDSDCVGKVRVYLNMGEPGNPRFYGFPSKFSFYAQSNGADLWVPAPG